MAAVALLPRVVGEPNGQRFALSPMPAAKSTSVTAPTFAPPSPPRAHVRQHIVLGLVSSAALVSLAPTPIAHPQTRVAPAGRPAPPHAQPEPVAPTKSPPTLTPLTPAAPQSPTPPPAVIPPPTPAAPQPAITITPTAPATVAVGVSIRSTVSARQPAANEQLAAVQSHTHDSSNNSEQGHPNHGKKHAQESPTSAGDAIPIAPVMPSPQQPEPIIVYNSTASTSGSASPASSAPDPSSAGLSAPQSSAQQSFPSSPPTRFDTSSHRHDDAATGPQGHTKGLSETLCRWCGLSAAG